MSLYEQNLEFIARNNPAVYQAIVGDKIISDNVEYLPDTSNYLISRKGMRILLHSEFDREREIDRLIRPIQETDKTVILFGIGNGLALHAIHKRFPQLAHLVVVEPNVEIVRQFLQEYDFVEAFSVFNKASFIIGKSMEEAQSMLGYLVLRTDILEKKITLVAPVAYRTLYADYYNALAQATVDAIRFYRVNSATLEAFRTLWLINVWRNLKYVSPDVGVFGNAFANIPAIIVSAGPSLQKNIHLLRKAKDRALIIAVGSAMTILEFHGITPHFRIAVDAAVENRPLFAKVDTSACPLIYSDHLFCEILPNYQGGKVHMAMTTNDYLVHYIFKKAGLSNMPIQSGFSVANIALNLLIKLQCSPIVFVGQDLCYSRGKLHAEGAWDQEIEDKYIKKDIETVDILGNPVFTDRAFLGMKKIFEEHFAAYPNVRFLNATEGGLELKGAANVKLSDLLENELATVHDVVGNINRILQEETNKLPDKAAKIDAVVKEIEAEVLKILDICWKIDQKYRKIHHMVEKGIKKETVMQETMKLRNMIQKLEDSTFYIEVVMPVFQEKFHLRRQVVDYKHDDWRQQWKQEIGLLRLEAQEIREYLILMNDLIEEYRGKRKLNIVFEN